MWFPQLALKSYQAVPQTDPLRRAVMRYWVSSRSMCIIIPRIVWILERVLSNHERQSHSWVDTYIVFSWLFAIIQCEDWWHCREPGTAFLSLRRVDVLSDQKTVTNNVNNSCAQNHVRVLQYYDLWRRVLAVFSYCKELSICAVFEPTCNCDFSYWRIERRSRLLKSALLAGYV